MSVDSLRIREQTAGQGEQTDFSLTAQAFRIGLVKRDVLAATAGRDRVVAMVADAPRQP